MISGATFSPTITARGTPFGGLMGGARRSSSSMLSVARPFVPLAHEIPHQTVIPATMPTAVAFPLIHNVIPNAAQTVNADDLAAYKLAHARLVSLMPSTTVLAYSTTLAKLLKSAKAALYLSQLVYWTRVGVDTIATRGWIHKTRIEWSNETGLSRNEQESARKRLVALNLIQEQRAGSPARLWFRVNLPILAHWLAHEIARGTLGLGHAHSAAGVPVGLDVPSAAGFELNETHQRWQANLRANDKAALNALLGSTQPFHLAIARITDTHSAVLLARMMWMQTKSLDNDARWFTYSTRSFEADLGMSRSQITTAMKQLEAKAWINIKTMPHPRLGKQSYYQLNAATLSTHLIEELWPKSDAASSGVTPASAADGLLGLLMRQGHEQYSRGNTVVTQTMSAVPTMKTAGPTSMGGVGRVVAQNQPTRFQESVNRDGGKSATVNAGFKQGESGKSATLKITLENTVLKTTQPTTTCALNNDSGNQYLTGGGGGFEINCLDPRQQSSAINCLDPRQQSSESTLYYPALAPALFAAVEQHIARLSVLPDYVLVAQSVLDELDGFMNPKFTHTFGGRFTGVASPVGWVRRVVDTALAGNFIPERAPVVATRRLNEMMKMEQAAAQLAGGAGSNGIPCEVDAGSAEAAGFKVAAEFKKFEPSQLDDIGRAGYEAFKAAIACLRRGR
jgi:hypothetical protein